MIVTVKGTVTGTAGDTGTGNVTGMATMGGRDTTTTIRTMTLAPSGDTKRLDASHCDHGLWWVSLTLSPVLVMVRQANATYLPGHTYSSEDGFPGRGILYPRRFHALQGYT